MSARLSNLEETISPRRLIAGWLFAFWIAGGWGFAFTQSAAAQGRPIDIDPVRQDPVSAHVSIGVDPNFPYNREFSWVPLTVELTNNKAAIEGELVVRFKDGSEQYRTPVDLPVNTTKLYHLMIFIPSTLDEIEFYIQSRRREIPVEVITVSATYMTTNRFIAVISKERDTHNHFSHQAEEEYIEMLRKVVYTQPPYLPYHPLGYQNIDALIWDGGPTSALSPEQDDALEKWIQMGGILILAAGEYWQELNSSPFRLYIPMTLTGSEVVEAGTRIQNRVDDVEPIFRNRQVIATGELIDDPHIRVLLSVQDRPYIIERRWGAGRIVFIASSVNEPVFDDPVHQMIFMDYITDGPLAMNSKIVTNLDQDIIGFMNWMVQRELPSTWFIAAYLGMYILIVVPINYIVFRMIGRLEWAWFTVPVWAIIFAYGAYYIGALRQQGSIAVNEINIVESRPSANIGFTTSYCSIYSPVRYRYTLEFDRPSAFPLLPQLDVGRSGGGGDIRLDQSLSTLMIGAKTVLDDFLIYHWSQRTLKAQHVSGIGEGMDIDLRWDGDRMVGSVANHTGKPIHDARIYIKEKFFDLYTIEPDQTVPVDQPIPTADDINQANNPRAGMIRMRNRWIDYNQFDRRPDRFIRDHLRDSYAFEFFQENFSSGQAVLVGRIAEPRLDFNMNRGEMIPTGETMLCKVFPFKKKMKGRLIIDTQSWVFTNVTSNNQRIMIGGYGGGYGIGTAGMPINQMVEQQIQPNVELTWDAVANLPLSGGKVESIKIGVHYAYMGYQPARNPNNPMDYELVNNKPAKSDYELKLQNRFTNEFEPLSQIVDAEELLVNPGRYLNKTVGELTLSLKAPPNRPLYFRKDQVNILLVVNFGTESGGLFLGRFVDAIDIDRPLLPRGM